MIIRKLLWLFQGFTLWFKTFLNELANNIISIIFILLVYLALWHFPQTIDLLLILNQAEAFIFEVPLYFGALTISAFLIWNIPKYYYYHNYRDITLSNFIGFIPNQHYKFQYKKEIVSYAYLTKIHMRKTVPRILAVLLLTISALSILHAMEIFNLENTYTRYLDPAKTLFAVIFFLLLLSDPRIFMLAGELFKKTPKNKYILPLVSIGLLLFILSLGTLNTQAEKDLGKLFLSNSALAILFFTLSFNSYSFLKAFPRKLFYGAILSFGFIILMLFLILNFNPDLSGRMNPLSILIFSFISLFMICFLLILIGKKIKLPLLTLVFFMSAFSASFFADNMDHYHLNLLDTEVTRPTLDEYAYQWIKDRKELIMKSRKKFPIIMISAEGGGSRAGLWSFLVHSYLYEKSKGNYFRHNLFSLTGASGGGVGNGMFFSVASSAHRLQSKANFKINSTLEYPVFRYKASMVYKENYLSLALLSFLGRDLLKEITGLFHFRNRGQILEDQWSESHYKGFKNYSNSSLLKKEFLSFYNEDWIKDTIHKGKGTLPLLFINTTHTQTGNYNIISPVRYSHLRALSGMNDFLDNLQSTHPKKSIALSTAMRINASFPYVTPVGEIKNRSGSKEQTDQYADAGYYDNIGGRVSIGLEKVFMQVLTDSFPELLAKIQIKQVLIANEEERKIAKTKTQLGAPLATLSNVRYGHTREVMKQLGNRYLIELKQTEIVPRLSVLSLKSDEKKAQAIKPVLPLGRYLSTIAIRSMEARLEAVSEQLDSILEIN